MITGNTAPNNSMAKEGTRRPRTLGFVLATMFCVVVGATAAACAEPEATFYVVAPVLGKVDAMSNTITCDPAGDSFNVAAIQVPGCHGVPRDLGPTANIVACFKLRSELLSSSDPTNNRIEKRAIVLNSSVSTLKSGGGGTFPATGLLDPGTVKPSEGAAFLTIGGSGSAAAVLASAGGTTQGSIIVKGRTTGGIDVETPEYFFQAEVVVFDDSNCK